MGGAPAEDRRLTRMFLWAVAAYFTAHWLLRAALGGSFEVDEAEMILLAQDFRLGYGPQLPLYNWWQAVWFHLFGVSAFAVAGAKNTMIAATYLALLMALRRFYPVRLAVMGALSLMLLPNILWEAQRANTHSTAMCLMMMLCLWAFARVATRGGWADYAFLGVALGLGVLSKYTFALYALCLLLAALSLPRFRPAVLTPRMGGAFALMAALAAAPLWWVQQNPAKSLGSVRKLYQSGGEVLSGWLQGLQLYAGALAAGLVLLVGIAGLMRWRARGGHRPLPADAQAFQRLMWRALALSVVLGAVGVAAAGVTALKLRWLLPQFLLAAPVVLIWGGARAGPVAFRRLAGGVAVLGALALIAMADIRLRGAGSDSLRVDLLADEIGDRTQGVPLVVSDYYFAGNLRYHRPGWRFWQLEGAGRPYAGDIVLVASGSRRPLTAHPLLRRLQQSHQLVETAPMQIGHRFAPQETRQIDIAILRPRSGADARAEPGG